MKNKNKLFGIIILIFVAVFTAAVYYYAGRPLIAFINKPAEFRNWVNNNGFYSYIAFVLMVVFQIIVAVIPGEPFEIGAGYAFGVFKGTLLCMIGSLIGGVIVFYLGRKFGTKLAELFIKKEKLDNIKFLKYSKKRNIIIFLLFLLPGTPKDVLSYCAGLTDIKLSFWIIICVFAKIPSIITSVICGSAVGSQNYLTAIITFIITAIISLIGALIYKLFTDRHNKHQ